MDEREQLREYVKRWAEAAPVLAEIREREIREADNVAVLDMLEDVFNHALTLPPRESSGLVEMQKYLAKLRR